MFEIADRLVAALDAGRTLAVATAVSIEGSAPRTVGTSMAFDGESVIGTIAGGCVESAVVSVAEEVLADGVPQTVEYGIDDEDAFSVGLTCGGQLRIRVQRVTPGHPLVDELRAAASGSAAAAALLVEGPAAGALPADVARLVETELAGRRASGRSGLATVDCGGTTAEVFFEVQSTRPHLVIVGAMDFSVALAAAAPALGYRVTVVDPRALFATSERFPDATVLVGWPHRILGSLDLDARSVVCVLSHDARFDADAIALALAGPASYVGAMGSRRTAERRLASLRERGVSEAALSRLRSPIGLDLGASTPAETAISILAEVIAARTGSGAAALTSTTGSIHAPPASAAPAPRPPARERVGS